MKRRIGILLTGVTYADANSKGKKDWRYSAEDVKENVIDCFRQDNDVSVHLTTYPNNTLWDLLNFYQPKTCLITEKSGSTQRSTYKKSLQELQNVNADFFICTRFDIHFYRPLSEIKFDYERANFLFKEEDPHWTNSKFTTDNLFCFPKKYLWAFIEAIDDFSATYHPDNWRSDLHAMYKEVARKIGEENCNIVYPEGTHRSDHNPYFILNYLHPTKKAT